jgi:hypothetical protein
MMGAAGRLARDNRAQFVVANVGVNLLFLVRTLIALVILDYRALGLVTLLQSIVLLIGVLQFGFLNGGYRLLCSAEGDEAGRVNNLVYSFMAALGLLALAFAASPRYNDYLMAKRRKAFRRAALLLSAAA